MEKIEVKGFDSPEETRNFPNGKAELVKIHEGTIARAVFQPGWKWSKDVKPIAKTESCQVTHFGYQVSGTMKVVMNDGTEKMCEPGGVAFIPPGHDAWVVGNEPVVIIDFLGMTNYAKKD